MKQIAWRVVFFCAILSFLLSGCAPGIEDWYAAFRGGYRADVRGTLNGVAFAAVIEAEPQPTEGARALTVTIYEPSGLSGTILRQETDGTVTLCSGDLILKSPKGEGLLALLGLFPTSGEIVGVSITDEGHTAVEGQQATLLFLPDGTPYAVKTAELEARVLCWTAHSNAP